jgi:hypothetical protein
MSNNTVPPINYPPPYPPQPPYYYQPQYSQPRTSPQERNRMKNSEIDKVIPKKKFKAFGSMQYRPSQVHFATQDSNEKVYVLVRQHWSVNWGWLNRNSFYILIPLIIAIVINFLNIKTSFLSVKFYFLILLAYYSLILTNIIRNFFDWYYDLYIVTNNRFLDYEFKPFTSYTIMEADLESIEDVKEKSSGFLADLFNYGDLKISTASKEGEVFFNKIPDPTKVRDILIDLSKIAKKYNNGD